MSSPAAGAGVPAARVEGLIKVYGGGVRALDGIDLEVPSGTIFGLLGPNGAGKTTLVKILLGICARTGGRAWLLGEPAPDASVRRRVGYLPEGHRFPLHLTGREALDYLGVLSHVPSRERRERGAALLEQVGLKEAADRKLRGYSKGMLQRLGLAQALIGDPRLVILDEPTDGVDPVGRREIRDLLVRMRAEGRTVIINSHILSELELVCDRIAVLNGGKIVHVGGVDDLTRAEGEWDLTLANAGPDLGGRLAAHADYVMPRPDGTGFRIKVKDDAALDRIVDEVRSSGASLRGLGPRKASLEEKVVELLRRPS